MTMFECATPRKRRRTGGVLRAALLGLTLPFLGCLDVEDPNIITPEDLEGAGAATALYVGAIGDFVAGYAGGAGDGSFAAGIVSASATLSDEVYNTDTFEERQELDRRQISLENPEVARVFRRLHRARVSLENAAARLDEVAAATGQPDSRVGELLALDGFTYLGFAENFCSGVPTSTVAPGGEIQYGSPQTRDQLLTSAVERFDAALAKAGGDVTVEALAQLGKARAQLNVGDFAAAGATAAAVPADFLYESLAALGTSAGGGEVALENGFYQANVLRQGISVADGEGGTGLAFRSVNGGAGDPRVPAVEDPFGGFDGSPLFVLLAYAITGTPLDQEAPMPLASGVEARLVGAEAQLQAGSFATPSTGTLAILNDLRASFVGGSLPPLVDPVTPSARADLLFAERAFWLYATGHRLGDLRRLIRQYGRTTEAVFPTGAYKGGPATYGADVNLPVPAAELNNPDFTGCLDRAA